MKVIEGFNAAIKRAQHLLQLYDILLDTRRRKVYGNWASKFNKLMQWPDSEKIVRIDGKGQKSILILRENLGIDHKHFTHDYVSELLRESIVAAVSALDRYMHDQVVARSWSILSKAEDKVPKVWRKVEIPAVEVKKAIMHQHYNKNARTGTKVKKAIQDMLHKKYTFQKPDDIEKAAGLLGIKEFWNEVSKKLNGNQRPEDVKKKLHNIVNRRNQIVHEADLERQQRARKPRLRDLSRSKAEKYVNYIEAFVKAVDELINSTIT
jgi:hypothetical protein